MLGHVHFVKHIDAWGHGTCREATVEGGGNGPDQADLLPVYCVDDFIDAMVQGREPELPRMMHNVSFDLRGAKGTWHFVDDCPFERKE